MTGWHTRTIEQRNLLNPAFCGVVIWHVANGYSTESAATGSIEALPLELAFVGASLVLRGQTRARLPTNIRTSMATWIQDHPLERSTVAKGIVVLRGYVREALIFGAQRGLLSFNGSQVIATDTIKKNISAYLRTSSADVRDCARHAAFVGRWLYKGGAPSTVLAMLGVRA